MLQNKICARSAQGELILSISNKETFVCSDRNDLLSLGSVFKNNKWTDFDDISYVCNKNIHNVNSRLKEKIFLEHSGLPHGVSLSYVYQKDICDS